MNYIYLNSYVLKGQAHNLYKRIRRGINKFLGGQKLIKTYIHSSIKKGWLKIPHTIQEMNTYRIHHIAELFLNLEGCKITKEYVNLERSRIYQYTSLFYLLPKVLMTRNSF
jgi:hypothetical protein